MGFFQVMWFELLMLKMNVVGVKCMLFVWSINGFFLVVF